MDPITLEIMRNRFQSIAEEMGATIVRTAYSLNIKERKDASCALFDTEGNTISQAEHVPAHLGVLPWGVKGALSRIDVGTLRPGDAIIHNDPWIGGTHLPDIFLIVPVFYGGELVAYVGSMAHHVDIGGMAPGSLTPLATEIFHEGFRFLPVKIRREGVIDQQIMELWKANIRRPYEACGDLMAQLAANNVGEKRFIEVCDECGIDTVKEAIRELDAYCDRRMAAELEKLPAGEYTFEDYLEGDGVSTDELLKIAVKITTGGPKIKFDFTGTCQQVKGPLNCVRPMVLATIYYVIRAVTDPTIPPNSGTYKRIEVITPEGTLLNCRFPCATGSGNAITAQRAVEVMLGALAKAIPDRICAAGVGSMNGCQFGTFDMASGNYFAWGGTTGGGYGGMVSGDGTSAVNAHMTNTQNTPIEMEEAMPVRLVHYGLAEDSEGPGRYRGGFGIEREWMFLHDDVECFIASDRVALRPWGLNGGLEADSAHFTVLRKDGSVEHLPSKKRVVFNRGDILKVRTCGGGGWGDPATRPIEEVAEDVKNGLISAARAKSAYQVCFDEAGGAYRCGQTGDDR